MSILTRYVVGETLKLLAISVLSLTAVLSISMAAKEAIRVGMPAVVVAQAMPFFIVEMLGYALPAAVLYAVCAVFGRMSGDHEVVALKSLGVNPLRLIEPVLLLAVFISLAAVVTYDLTATWGRPGIRRLLAESAADVAVGVLRTQRSIDMPWGSVAVRAVADERLISPHIRLAARDGQPETVLAAASGELQSDSEGMRLVLQDIEAEVGPRGSASYPGRFVVPLPFDTGSKMIHRDWLAMREIPAHRDEYLRQAADTSTALERATTATEADALKARLKHLEWKACRLGSEPHRRWANGFSCIAFAAIGIPLAIFRRNSDAISTFFVAFLPILLCFYPLLMTSEELAMSGRAPGWVFWSADVLLAGAGLWLLRRVARR